MNDNATVCRVCWSHDGVMLDLFGSNPQTAAYAEDIKRCLSVQVTEGDGLPSKICIKCMGLLSDCRPFVDNIAVLRKAKNSDLKNSSSEESCCVCISSENPLFPIPDVSVKKLQESFDIFFSIDKKICHRCQFHLESLHDLKVKARASLEQFYSNSPSFKEEKRPPKEESVGDIVTNLKNKLKMDQQGRKSPKIARPVCKSLDLSKRDKQTKKSRVLPQVLISDITLLLGSDFLSKGTINVNEFFKKLNSSKKVNGIAPLNKKPESPKESSSPGASAPENALLNCEPSNNRLRRFSKDSDDASESNLLSLKVVGRKRCKDSESYQPSKRSRVSSESKTPETLKKKPSKMNKENTKIVRNERRGTVDRGKVPDLGETNESDSDRLDGNTTVFNANEIIPASIRDEESESQSAKSGTNIKKIESLKEDDIIGKSHKRRAAASQKGSSQVFSEENEEDSSLLYKRKRKPSEERDLFSKLKSKRSHMGPQPAENGSGLDETRSSGRESFCLVQQPAFLKEVDELLKLTPKSAFRPYICSVCHEGYVSTVKGKVHKLVIHDPHSNLVLKLIRCDDDPDLSLVLKAFHERVDEGSGETQEKTNKDWSACDKIVENEASICSDVEAPQTHTVMGNSESITQNKSAPEIDPADRSHSDIPGENISQNYPVGDKALTPERETQPDTVSEDDLFEENIKTQTRETSDGKASDLFEELLKGTSSEDGSHKSTNEEASLSAEETNTEPIEVEDINKEVMVSETESKETMESETECKEMMVSETESKEKVESETESKEMMVTETESKEVMVSETESKEMMVTETESKEVMVSETECKEVMVSETGSECKEVMVSETECKEVDLEDKAGTLRQEDDVPSPSQAIEGIEIEQGEDTSSVDSKSSPNDVSPAHENVGSEVAENLTSNLPPVPEENLLEQEKNEETEIESKEDVSQNNQEKKTCEELEEGGLEQRTSGTSEQSTDHLMEDMPAAVDLDKK